ncbi:S24 family peptidase, partial [Pelagibacteraceae bacterium]|nr:S24 family peptidase [Pelagibacteraceae bacterium]
ALEHHIFAITNISSGINIGAGDTVTLNKNDIFDQDQETILTKYISIIEPEKYENYNFFLRGHECIADRLLDIDEEKIEANKEKLNELKNFEVEIAAMKDFYIICEDLRKKYLPNFYSPSEYKKINFINDDANGFLMKKSAIRKKFKVEDFSKLFLVKSADNYMEPIISSGDECLAIKTTLGETNAFKGGLFVVKEFGKIVIRRLQFTMFEDTYQIISIPDNKKYSRQTIQALDNKGKPRNDYIIGKVIWKSGFTLEENNNNLNLFDNEKDEPISDLFAGKKRA